MNHDVLQEINAEPLFPVQSDQHIVFGVDGKFKAHALITILSIMKHAGDRVYHFHLISSELTPADNPRLARLFQGSRHGVTLHHLPDQLFATLPVTELFTRATYYRFLAPLILPQAEKLLYLDADMVCINPLNELWQIPTGPGAVALVVGEIASLQPVLAKNAGLRGERYFNAGMMLIDVAQWRADNISERAFTLLSEHGRNFQYLDQDALNILLEDKVTFVSPRFNTLTMLAHDDRGYTLDVPAETCLIHYAGADKPWQVWNQQFVVHHYRDIYQDSPLSTMAFDQPANAQQAKRMYKSLFRQKRWWQAMLWRLKHIKMRYC